MRHWIIALLLGGCYAAHGPTPRDDAGRPPDAGSPIADPFVQVVGGGDHACALRRSGAVDCWGGNEAGQLGLPTREALDGLQRVPIGRVLLLSAAFQHTCAVVESGFVECWGHLRGGDVLDTRESGPRRIEGLWTDPEAPLLRSSWDAICAGRGDHSRCVGSLLEFPRGTPYIERVDELPGAFLPAGARDFCRWEQDTDGHVVECTVTRGGEVSREGPFRWDRVDDVQPGGRFRCALTRGQAQCWGLIPQRECARLEAPEPQPLALPPLRAISLGGAHGCALTERGEVYCFGLNSQGQAGAPPRSCTLVLLPYVGPTRVVLPTSSSVVAAAAFSCAVGVDGRVRCWGNNASGQLGVSAEITEASDTPILAAE